MDHVPLMYYIVLFFFILCVRAADDSKDLDTTTSSSDASVSGIKKEHFEALKQLAIMEANKSGFSTPSSSKNPSILSVEQSAGNLNFVFESAGQTTKVAFKRVVPSRKSSGVASRKAAVTVEMANNQSIRMSPLRICETVNSLKSDAIIERVKTSDRSRAHASEAFKKIVDDCIFAKFGRRIVHK